jgi:putative NADPH-quinone reductase
LRQPADLASAGKGKGATRRILVINGHPDASSQRFCAALAQRYADAARAAGHEVRLLSVGALAFDMLRSRAAFEDDEPAEVIFAAQQQILWAQHLVIVHPLWLGAAPAVLKGFFEQAFRYGFAMPRPGLDSPHGRLGGRSARLIVTMGMPAWIHRTVFGAFGVRAMVRGILRISGIGPVRVTLIGQVEGSADHRRRWLDKVAAMGSEAA